MLRKYAIALILILVTLSCGVLTPAVDPEDQNPQIETVDTSPLGDGLSSQDTLISINDLNQNPPEDIIQEVIFFGGLGGSSGCWEENYNSPAFFSNDASSQKVLIQKMQHVEITICGLPQNEQVGIKLIYPNGNEVTMFQDVVSTNGTDKAELTFDYIPRVDDPLGLYKFIFSGTSWSLEYVAEVINPIGSRLYLFESQLFFVNFSPSENVRLLVYRANEENEHYHEFLGWQWFQVNEQGSLHIDVDIDGGEYIALGEISGDVNYEVPGHVLNVPLPVHCEGARTPIGIKPLKYAEIVVNSLPSYEYDSQSGRLIRTGDVDLKGTVVRVETNAICFENAFIWQVSCPGKQCKYLLVPEAGPEGYYLRPIDELPPTPTLDSADIPICPGTQPSRLQVGMTAEVTRSGMAPQLSLRSQPSMSAEKVHVIAAGRKITILQGPVCADGSYWWYIRSEQGFEGWAREGDNEDYWIDPLP